MRDVITKGLSDGWGLRKIGFDVIDEWLNGSFDPYHPDRKHASVIPGFKPENFYPLSFILLGTLSTVAPNRRNRLNLHEEVSLNERNGTIRATRTGMIDRSKSDVGIHVNKQM
jgi:hypothetical protein